MEFGDLRIESEILDKYFNMTMSGKTDKYYTHDGVDVPRVTRILKACISNEGLVKWASRVGYKKMEMYRNNALESGSLCHSLIEDYINGNHIDMILSGDTVTRDALMAFNNFKSWFSNLAAAGHQFKLVGSEIELTCPYFGGTLDCLAYIDDKLCIIDWKTSKTIYTEYYFQLAAYRYMVNNFTNLGKVDHIGIIRLEKKQPGYQELFFSNIDRTLDYFEQGFLRCLEWYYYLKYVEMMETGCTFNELIKREEMYD